MRLFYTCPKRKCRHAWSRKNSKVLDMDCPKCGAVKICPVNIEGDKDE